MTSGEIIAVLKSARVAIQEMHIMEELGFGHPHNCTCGEVVERIDRLVSELKEAVPDG